MMDNSKVFVSIVENGDSEDRTRELLANLQNKLDDMQVSNRFVLNKRYTRGEDRIPHLANLRNLAIEPIKETTFPLHKTRIIFLNDIYFKAEDIRRLIFTNNMHYDYACGLDFNKTNFYDTWVARDIQGHELNLHYPYFEDAAAQQQVRNGKPVRVFCCWNGVIVMKAEPFATNKVRFRERKPEEVYHSECFFLCKDFWNAGYTVGLINPQVRVSYSWKVYYLINYVLLYTWSYINDFRVNYISKMTLPANPESIDLTSKDVPNALRQYKMYT
jgi:hypothetical protein